MNYRKYNGSIKELFMQNIGVETLEEINEWFVKGYNNEYKIDGIKELAEFLRNLSKKPYIRITVVGDYDVDGMAGTAILLLLLIYMGFKNIHYRIPKRFTEGYGLNETIVDEIPDGVIITVDNGIAAIEEIKKAKEKGLYSIILDHHKEFRDEGGNIVYPDADILIDPEAIPESADFPNYCGAGLAYKLAREIIADASLIYYIESLAAIATIADVMPLKEENYMIVRNGLKRLADPTITYSALYQLLNNLNLVDKGYIDANDVGFKIAPALNAMSRLNDDGASKGVELLIYNNKTSILDAMEKANEFMAANALRKEYTKEYIEEAEKIAMKNSSEKNVIIINLPDAPEGVLGIIAGKLTDKYEKPTIVVTNTIHGYLKGSARSIDGFDLKRAIDNCQSYLSTYGGHAGAAGLSLDEEKLESFDKAMNQLFERIYVKPTKEKKEKCIYIKENEIAHSLQELMKYGPYGEGNKEPMFCIEDFKLKKDNYGNVGKKIKGNGIKLNGKCAAMSFSFDEEEQKKLLNLSTDKEYKVYGKLVQNFYKGNFQPQFIFEHIE